MSSKRQLKEAAEQKEDETEQAMSQTEAQWWEVYIDRMSPKRQLKEATAEQNESLKDELNKLIEHEFQEAVNAPNEIRDAILASLNEHFKRQLKTAQNTSTSEQTEESADAASV